MDFQSIYAKVQGYTQMNQAEAQKLYDCAKRLPEDAVVVEIGTYRGGSAAIMAAAIQGKVYSIDIEPDLTDLESWAGSQGVADEVIKKILFIKGSSEEAAEKFDKPIDMLFIDGSHFYVDVHKDISNWVPKVKDNGIICFHDYGSHTDVTIAVNEALMKRIGFSNHSLLAIVK